MSLPSRLRQPLVPAVVAVLVGGLLAFGPADATGPDTAERVSAGSKTSPADREKEAAKDGLTRSRVRFKKSSYLCYGYASCSKAGMGNAGYASNGSKMYWRMYAGHNCTNYAAYRMVKNGLPNQRPWSGGGNATYWGTSVPQLTNSTPSVGAVAWWRANAGPAGSAGHVAYVEQIVSADEIIVSQDSWRGDFSWARITRASGNWPSGFIHFNDMQLVSTAAPVVSGVAQVGSKLTATTGAWQPGATAIAYQWYANGAPIAKATKPSLSLTKARLGQVLTVQAVGSRSGYSQTAVTSAPTAAVAPGTLSNTVAPVLSGTAKVEGTLKLATGSWSPAVSGVVPTWYSDGVLINGASGTSLKLTPELAGHIITAGVSASRAGYATLSVAAPPTVAIAPGTIRVRRQPKISGKVRPGETLTLDTGAYRPTDAGVSVQWLRDGQPVAGATGTTYQLSAVDLGTRLSASVSASRFGYDAIAPTAPQTPVVRAASHIKIQRVAGRRAVRLVIRVAAKDVPVVTGTVKVRIKGGFRQTVTLKNGVARVVVKALPSGRHPARIAYSGSATVTKLVRKAVVRMPAPQR